ncbi:MAG: hypothetical protein EAY75_01615 [Bacteroidetes bacterium]|nr:MAG: hypothetical protein EAY75_01615 [Bacteroidota bacterium]
MNKSARCRTVFLLFMPLLLAASCKKDKLADELSKLPPATQTGANTFGCLVNGKAWVPQGGCFLCPSVLKFYYYNDNKGEFSISATRKSGSIHEFVSLGVTHITQKKEYQFPLDTLKGGCSFLDFQLQTSCGNFNSRQLGTTLSGTIRFTKRDLNVGILSGIFDLQIAKPNCGTITLTNGRFDAKL